MAYRELHVVEIKEALRLWSRGHGFRTVARRTGVDRKTVRRYVEAAQKAGLGLGAEVIEDALIADVAEAVRPGSSAEAGKMREHLRAHADEIRKWMDDGCRGPRLPPLACPSEVHRTSEPRALLARRGAWSRPGK